MASEVLNPVYETADRKRYQAIMRLVQLGSGGGSADTDDGVLSCTVLAPA